MIMKNKHGQTQQVFVYIMVILVVGAVLLFGYKSINKLIGQSCDVDLATFQTELKTTLEDNNGYGDVTQKSIKDPCAYEKICFVNSTTDTAKLPANINILRGISSSMADEVIAGTGNNVFLIKGSTTVPLYGLDYLDVPGNATAKGFLCIGAKSNTFDVMLEGIGKGRVRITQGS